jgi:hypothetical protein
VCLHNFVHSEERISLRNSADGRFQNNSSLLVSCRVREHAVNQERFGMQEDNYASNCQLQLNLLVHEICVPRSNEFLRLCDSFIKNSSNLCLAFIGLHYRLNYWVFGLFPLSGILGSRKHDVSLTGRVSVFRWGRNTLTQLDFFERANLNYSSSE